MESFFKIEINSFSALSKLSFVASAHKNTQYVLDLIKKYDKFKMIWITVAGKSNALSGVVAANSKNPVIACPCFSDKIDMMEEPVMGSFLDMESN